MGELGPLAFIPEEDRAKWKAVAEEFGPVEANLQALESDTAVRLGFETDGTFRFYRIQGLTEPQALEALERDDKLWELALSKGIAQEGEATGFRAFARKVLRKLGLLDEHPVGWDKDENEAIAKAMEFEDVVWRVSQIVDAPRAKIIIGSLLAAQGHLAPVLRAVGPAIHAVFLCPKWGSGKSRAAEAFTILGKGKWLAAATVAYMKSARANGPCILGIDEGDEAEKESPGVKAYLLTSADWDATYGKFSEPTKESGRTPEEIPFGGPVFITFRAKPWPQVASRAVLFDMERSKKASVSDKGAVMESFLAPCRVWLRERCASALRDKDELWAKLEIGKPEFLARLDRVSKDTPTFRSRDKARSLLLIADLLGIDFEKEIRATVQEDEDVSESAVLIEAILSDSSVQDGVPVPFEELRLNVQKKLKDARDPTSVSQPKFTAALTELEWVKDSLMWNRAPHNGKRTTMLYPAVFKKAHPEYFDNTGSTAFEFELSGERPDGLALPAIHDILRELCTDGRNAILEEVLRRAHERGIAPERATSILKRMKTDGELYEPVLGAYRLTENLGR